MSLGYAQKLSYKEDLGGSFGKPEVVESGQERLRKASLLADWVWGPVYIKPLDATLRKWFAIPDDNNFMLTDQEGGERCCLHGCWHLDELWHIRLQVCSQAASTLSRGSNTSESSNCLPLYRGPQGVWTLQKQGLPFDAPVNAFALAKPSLTHQVSYRLTRSALAIIIKGYVHHFRNDAAGSGGIEGLWKAILCGQPECGQSASEIRP